MNWNQWKKEINEHKWNSKNCLERAIYIYIGIYNDIFGFCFVLFLFLIIQSQAAFVNCLYVARFTIVHSKRQIKFLLLLLILLLLLSLLLAKTLMRKNSDEKGINDIQLQWLWNLWLCMLVDVINSFVSKP